MPASYTVKVDWNNDGDFSDTGEDVTARTLDGRTPVTMRYGRDQARALSPAAVGEATFELNNLSRDYSPENASSPLAGLVRPGRPVRTDAALQYTADTFTGRTVANGWGTSSSGHAWTATGGTAANYAIASGVGTITLTTVNVSRRLVLAAADQDCRVSATLSVSAVATGAPIRVALIPRGATLADDHQRAQLNFDLSGALSLSLVKRVAAADTTLNSVDLVGTYTVGTQVSLVVEAIGSTLRAKAWLTASTEPADWQATSDVDLISAVETGIRALSATGNTNTNPVVTVDNWSSGLAPTLYGGYLDDFTIKPDLQQRSVDVTCTDALGRLRGAKVTTAMYRDVRTGEAIGYLLDAVGWPADRRDLDIGASLLPYWWADDDDAYDALMRIVDSEGPAALATVDSVGRIVFRDRHHRLQNAPSLTAQSTWRDAGTEPTYSGMEYDHGWKEIVNSVAFEIPARAPAAEYEAVWATQGLTTVAAGETVLLSARATDPFIGALVPVEDVDYRLLSGTVTITLARDSGGSTTVYLTASAGGPVVLADLQLRAYPVRTVTSLLISAEDASSVSAYGRRSQPDERAPVWASPGDARAIASLILGQRAERLPTVSVTMAGGNTARLADQLSRNLSDRVHVVDAHTGLDADCFVEQIAHTITQGGAEHRTTFGLEKAATQIADVFILGSATNGVLGTNRLGKRGLTDPSTMFVVGSATNGVLGTNILAL